MAQRDWVERERLSEEQLYHLPAYCSGTYVAPPDEWQVPEVFSSSEAAEANAAQGKEAPIQGRALYLESDQENWIRLTGGVELRQGAWRLLTESAVLDRKSNRVELPQGVTMRSQTTAISGEKAEFDVGERVFSVEDASFLIYEQHARGSAANVHSDQNSKLYIENGFYTTCPPGGRSWSLTSTYMVLDQKEGEGVARDLLIRVRDVPVLYFPYLSFPLDDRRRSGFLYPSITNSNAGSGIDFTMPYYLNLAPDYDATFSPRYIHGRGILSDLEGRHLSHTSKTVARIAYIEDDHDYRDKTGDDDGSRWALDFGNEAVPGAGWYSYMDINSVSDPDYLKDLNRTLEIAEESHLRRLWTLNYSRDFAFQSRVLGYQTIDTTIPSEERPYLLLPQLNLTVSQLYQGFTFDFSSEYTYFWRDNETLADEFKVNGNRWRNQPSVAYPLTATWGYLTPKIRLDQTDYVLQDQTPGVDRHISRSVPFYSVDSGLYFDRSTHLFGRHYNQSLEPRLFYVYSPESAQDDIPNFDSSVATFSYSQLYREDRFVGGDRVGDNNRVTLGLTSRLNDMDEGNEILRASIGRIFYIRDQLVSLEGQGTEDRDGSPLAGELLWRPNERVDVKVEGQWSADTGTTDRGSTTMSFHDPDYDSLVNFSHRYDVSNLDSTLNLEQAEISGLQTLTPSVSVLGRWLFDLVDHRTIGMLGGIEYSSCCWRVQFLVRDALTDTLSGKGEMDRGYFLRFELRGLGSLSNDLEEVLANEMRNFSERQAYRKERFRW